MMIAWPKAVGCAPACWRRAPPSSRSCERQRPARARAAARPSRRRQFSTMMTAPSTIRPKSIAPRLIRLPLMRVCTMPMAVISIESGIASAVIKRGADVAEQQEEHDDDQDRALDQVLGDRADRRVDQLRAVEHRLRARCPGGSVRCTSRHAASTAAATVRLLAPISISAVPTTTSSPFSLALPVRSSRPMPTRGDVARRRSACRRARRRRCCAICSHRLDARRRRGRCRSRRCARRSRRRC